MLRAGWHISSGSTCLGVGLLARMRVDPMQVVVNRRSWLAANVMDDFDLDAIKPSLIYGFLYSKWNAKVTLFKNARMKRTSGLGLGTSSGIRPLFRWVRRESTCQLTHGQSQRGLIRRINSRMIEG